nr:MAG TPA: hypothetical protein [Caudoviricetes sp.]
MVIFDDVGFTHNGCCSYACVFFVDQYLVNGSLAPFRFTSRRGHKFFFKFRDYLTGGWIGLAAAIAYAGYCLYEYNSEKQQQEK